VGREPSTPNERQLANYREVSPGNFVAKRASRAGGRWFAESDNATAAPVAIVSSALAARYLGAASVGRVIMVDDNDTGPRPLTVVGVVHDMRHTDLAGPPAFDIFIPVRQMHRDGVVGFDNNQFWTVRLAGRVDEFGPVFTRVLRGVDPDAATAGAGPLEAYVARWLAPRRFSVGLLSGFALVALLLAGFGVYGVVAYSVERRRREIGLRLALGSTPAAVLRLVLEQVLRVTAMGIACGLAGSLLGGRAIAGLLYGVNLSSPILLGAVALLLSITTTAASLLPAWRASRTDPGLALSGES
jgi:hypothetical protein